MPISGGIELPSGIRLINGSPVDIWAGPYISVAEANTTIPIEVRYKSMLVHIIGDTPDASSKLYWYKNGITDNDLVEFTAGQNITDAVGGIQIVDTEADLPISNQSPTILYITKDTNIGYFLDLITGEYVKINSFKNDITVSLPAGKSFGKYMSGVLIPSKGKTAEEIILEAIRESQNPIPSLTFTPSSIPFNSTSALITIGITPGIKNEGANVSSHTIIANYNNVSEDLQIFAYDTITDHNIDLINNFVSGEFVTYTYTIRDTENSTATIIQKLSIDPYVPPSRVLSINTTDREIGDIGTTISGTITKQSQNVPLKYARIQFKSNINSIYTELWKNDNILNDPSTFSIPQFQHNPIELITDPTTYPTSITYILEVKDTYQEHISQTLYSSEYNINFYPYIYYGIYEKLSNILIDNSTVTQISQLTANDINISKLKIKNKTFNRGISTINISITNSDIRTDTQLGNTLFFIALPASKTINDVVDSRTNISIKNSFNLYSKGIPATSNNITINYNIYIYSNSIAYSEFRDLIITF